MNSNRPPTLTNFILLVVIVFFLLTTIKLCTEVIQLNNQIQKVNSNNKPIHVIPKMRPF